MRDCLKDIKDFPRNKTLINAILNNNMSYYQQHCYKFCFDLNYINDNPCNCTANIGNIWNKCYKKKLNNQVANCTNTYKKNFNKKNIFEICSQYCPMQCDSVIYQNTYSIIPHELHKVRVYIYYGELKYTYISQQPKMVMADLISNIGGIFGVFGMSFLSFIEPVEIIFEIFYILLFKK